MKNIFLFYIKFVINILILLAIVVSSERYWLSSGLEVKKIIRIFIFLVVMLLFYFVAVCFKKIWPKIKMLAVDSYFKIKNDIKLYLRQYHSRSKKILYFLPFILRTVWKSLGKYLSFLVSIVTLAEILNNIFLLNSEGESHIAVLLIFWIISIWLCNFKSTVSLILGLTLLIISSGLFLMSQFELNDRTVIWAYIFLLLGTVQRVSEYKLDVYNNGNDEKTK